MSSDILNLINNNKWDAAMSKLTSNFERLFNGRTMFHYACMRGNKKVITQYLKLKSDQLYLSDNDGNTGAHLLAFSEWDNVLLDVVAKYPIFLKLKNANDEFIHDIVITRPATLIKIINLLKKNKYTKYLNYISNNNRTLLLDVIYHANINDSYLDIIKELQSANIDINIPAISPPLIYSIFENYDKVTMFMLDNINVNINVQNSNQYTPLIASIVNNNSAITKKILKMNPDVNYAGFENIYVPLSLCFRTGMTDIAKLLLTNKNINYDKLDNKLNTPIYYLIDLINSKIDTHIAIKSNKSNKQNKSDDNLGNEYNDLLQKMIENCDLNNNNVDNITPLHLLVKYGMWKKFEHIIKNKKIDVNAVSKKNETPLSYVSDDDIDSFLSLSETNNPIELRPNNITLPPTSDDSNFGLFNADGLHNVVYTFAIMKKYANLAAPLQSYNIEKFAWESYNLITNVTLDTKKSQLCSVMKLYTAIFSVLPFIMIWRDKDLNYVHKDTVYLERLLRLSDVRFIVLRLSIIHESTMHANIIIYDKKLCKLIRFEPYGDWEMSDMYYLDQTLINMFKNILGKNKKFKFIKPTEFLDKTKFQTISLGDEFGEQNLGDPSGYCLAWCFWFLELKMLNPEEEENDLVNFALKKIIQSNNKSSNPLLEHIRSYAKQLDTYKTDLLVDIGIHKSEIYKLTHTHEKVNMLIKYIQTQIR